MSRRPVDRLRSRSPPPLHRGARRSGRAGARRLPARPPQARHRLDRRRSGCSSRPRSCFPLTDHARSTFCVPASGRFARRPAPTSSTSSPSRSRCWCSLGALVVVLLSLDTVRDSRLPAGEYYFLLLMSVSGAVTLAASRDVLTLVVSLEVVSLPAFALVALPRYDGRGQRGGAEALPRLGRVDRGDAVRAEPRLRRDRAGAISTASRPCSTRPVRATPRCCSGVALSIAGFAFKVAAVPFHFWAPDTYVGAPVPVAAYLSVVSKAAGFVGLAAAAHRSASRRTPTSGARRWRCWPRSP